MICTDCLKDLEPMTAEVYGGLTEDGLMCFYTVYTCADCGHPIMVEAFYHAPGSKECIKGETIYNKKGSFNFE